MQYAKVVLFKKLGAFDDEITYEIPDNIASACNPGSIVHVPFHSQIAKGIVTSVSADHNAEFDVNKIKPILCVIFECLIDKKQIDLARFIAFYYHTSMGRAIRLILPKYIWNGKLETPTRTIYKLIEKNPVLKGEKQKKVFETLIKNEGLMPLADLKREFSLNTLRSLLKKEVIQSYEEPVYRIFDPKNDILKIPDKVLTPDQAEILKQISLSDKPILLHGITGSGKTEIYLREILNTIQNGKQAILLVPEIALTPQMINYFKDYFLGHVAVFHSQLTDGERAAEWWKVKLGHSPLIIGSRSAIFAPTPNLGLIILDEEHEWNYKQESAPYYETHRVAEEIYKLNKISLILGSATPKAESYQKTREGEYMYLHLPEKIFKNNAPKINIVDLRDEFKKRNFSIFSLMLQNKIKERLQNREQIILFVNQRGMAGSVTCRDCGYTEKCPNCDISLKLHRMGAGIRNKPFVILNSFQNPALTGKPWILKQVQDDKTAVQDYNMLSQNAKLSDKLVCHYCNYSKAPEIICPECKSHYIKHIGIGTQRVEEEAHKLFPQARVIRADSDSIKNKNQSFSDIYNDFMDHKYDILIGTQMVAKGLDFEKVSLVGIVLADIGLNIPDFRSSERLFQILTQVAGRCGRRETPGEVVLQTYNPDHYTIKKIAGYEYNDFIENELSARSKFNYPPFGRMIKFTVVGNDMEKLTDHIKIQQETLEDIFKINNLQVKITSAPAMVSKVSNRYYYNVLLRANDPNIIFAHWQPPKGWRIDVDPVHTT